MIARMWRGRVPAAKADSYNEYLKKTGFADYQATPGNKGVLALRRIKGDEAEFLLITLWDSYESIKKFAGEDYEKARYYAEDKDFLLEFEEHVSHFEVLVKP
ncbi:MAG: antibiotic biosynthesis monooxygenase [Ignavibacteriae bacterium]|nr:antibiotic biosynthesis monooxygenase [Ignavibacteriota bacterium]